VVSSDTPQISGLITGISVTEMRSDIPAATRSETKSALKGPRQSHALSAGRSSIPTGSEATKKKLYSVPQALQAKSTISTRTLVVFDKAPLSMKIPVAAVALLI